MATLKADSASAYRAAAVATLSAAVAGITLLSGLLQLRLAGLHVRPLIAIEMLPSGRWSNSWLPSARSAAELQSAALTEWLRLVVVLLLIILIISAISALIALFAHATARRYEIALSAVVGATRAQLTRLQLRNAAVNAAWACSAGISIGLLAAYSANRAWPHVSEDIEPLAWIVISAVFACALAAFVGRAIAARMAHPGWMGDVLAPEARTNPGYGAEDLRNVLLHLQFAFAFALLAVALLIRQDARPLRATNTEDRQVYVARVALPEHASSAQRRAWQQRLEAQRYAIASPGVLIGVGESDHVLAKCGPCSFANMALPFFALRTQQHVVSAGFFARTGFPLTQGREFEAKDASARHVVVNDTFANLAFQGQPAVGKTIQVGGLAGDWYTVVGVIADIPISGLLSFAPDTRTLVRSRVPGREPAIYFNSKEKPPAVFDVVGMTGGAGARPLRDVIASARAPGQWFGQVLGALSAVAALIAMLSLAAITLLNVRQRQGEIAARRAVGARRRDILALVMKSTLGTIARGTVIGIILSLATARVIQMMLPGLSLFDGKALLLAALLLAAVSLVAAIIPARSAAQIEPARIHV